ncbi:hypothetical protein Agub_g10065, partial [Astrephomene gubernaculifera]
HLLSFGHPLILSVRCVHNVNNTSVVAYLLLFVIVIIAMLALQRTVVSTGWECYIRRRRPFAVQVHSAAWHHIPPATIANRREVSYNGCTTSSFASPPFARTVSSGSLNATGPSGSATPQSQQQQLGIFQITGDGACMFRAIVQGAQIASRGKPMPPGSEEAAAHNLRLAVVQELRKRREEMEPFLPGIAADFDQYCRTMSHPMAWGGEPEMVMAVHVVQRPITVFHVQGGALEPIVTYGDHL